MDQKVRKIALAAGMLAFLAGPALAAGPGESTATSGTTKSVGSMDANGNGSTSTTVQPDKRGDSSSSQTATQSNVNAGMNQGGNAETKGQVGGSSAGGITK